MEARREAPHPLEREAQRHELAAARYRQLGEHERADAAMRRAVDCRFRINACA